MRPPIFPPPPPLENQTVRMIVRSSFSSLAKQEMSSSR